MCCVLSTFFVCTACSGICRRFSWRVKGVSMSNFTDEEISKLQSGGNEVGRALWLAKWNNTIYALPNPGEEKRIIRFMKHTFEKQTWKQGEGVTVPKVAAPEAQKNNIGFGAFTPVAPPAGKQTAAIPDDGWDDDPFPTPAPAVGRPPVAAAPYQQPKTQPAPVHPPPAASSTQQILNLLGDPISSTPLVPSTPVQQPAPQPTPPKTGWDGIDFTGMGQTGGVGTGAAPTNSYDQRRLDLQRQQEDLARQQQALQQQALQQQAMQQAMQQQAMQQAALQQQALAYYQQQQQQLMMGQVYAQPPFAQQPPFVQQFPPVMQAPPPVVQNKPEDPFANLNWL